MTVIALGWDRLVGQDRAVALHAQAAARPVHAYLLVGAGARASRTAARCFAAALVGAGRRRARRRPRAARHASRRRRVRARGTRLRRRRTTRERIIPEASRSPIEGDRKVVVVSRPTGSSDRPSGERAAEDDRGAAARTVMLLVTVGADELLPTSGRGASASTSRDPSDATSRRPALGSEGRCRRARRAACASPAVSLAGPARSLGPTARARDAFVDAATVLDGTGARGRRPPSDRRGGEAAHGRPRATPGRGRRRSTPSSRPPGIPTGAHRAGAKRLAERHEARATGALAPRRSPRASPRSSRVYRDALAGAGAPAQPRPDAARGRPRAAAAALDACRRRARRFERNPNEGLLLERLLLHLPAAIAW